jgi:hypothetical protein
MCHCNSGRLDRPLQALRTQFAQADGLPFADVLSADAVDRALQAEHVSCRDCLYTPLVTLWAFLSQVLSPDGSLRLTVARVLAWLVGRGQPPCSAETGPYCKARQRLPEGLLRRLVQDTGQTLHQQAPTAWQWKGRRVKLVDGTTVSMPDTPANQAAYPQHTAQKAGIGFPIARLVVVFCLAVGTVLESAIGRYQGKQTGENVLFRTLWDSFAPGDVALGDRYFCSYFDIAGLLERGVDVVFRMHQARKVDFRRGRRLGRDDHVVVWDRPQRPAWMDAGTYHQMPVAIVVRESRVRVAQPGFRTEVLIVATTLLDAAWADKKDLADLYRRRWHAELDLRSLKVTLGMDVLRCQSPAMVRKEIWAHLLAYNLIRTVMAQAAHEHGVEPRQVSFTGALQTVSAFADTLLLAQPEDLPGRYRALLEAIATHRVGDRPDRVEPRKRKRRPKHYPLLTVPRQQARAALL